MAKNTESAAHAAPHTLHYSCSWPSQFVSCVRYHLIPRARLTEPHLPLVKRPVRSSFSVRKLAVTLCPAAVLRQALQVRLHDQSDCSSATHRRRLCDAQRGFPGSFRLSSKLHESTRRGVCMLVAINAVRVRAVAAGTQWCLKVTQRDGHRLFSLSEQSSAIPSFLGKYP